MPEDLFGEFSRWVVARPKDLSEKDDCWHAYNLIDQDCAHALKSYEVLEDHLWGGPLGGERCGECATVVRQWAADYVVNALTKRFLNRAMSAYRAVGEDVIRATKKDGRGGPMVVITDTSAGVPWSTGAQKGTRNIIIRSYDSVDPGSAEPVSTRRLMLSY